MILLVVWFSGPVKGIRAVFHATRLDVLLLYPLLLSYLLAHLFPLLRIEVGADDDGVAGHSNGGHNGTHKASEAPAFQRLLIHYFFTSCSFFSSSCFSYNLSSPVTSLKIGGQI